MYSVNMKIRPKNRVYSIKMKIRPKATRMKIRPKPIMYSITKKITTKIMVSTRRAKTKVDGFKTQIRQKTSSCRSCKITVLNSDDV